MEVRILSSHRDWEIKASSFLMIIFQRNGFKILKKDTPELSETHTHLEGTEKGFTVVSSL